MICDRCGLDGTRWMGPFSALTHTECPNCGAIDGQRIEHDDEERKAQSEEA